MEITSSPHFHLLSVSNPKLQKGVKFGWMTAVLHLSPADLAVPGKSVCPFATEGCKASCLNLAGRGGMMATGEETNKIQEARKRKTRFFFENREDFFRVLRADIVVFKRWVKTLGLKPAIRLNGTSDLPVLPLTIAPEFPEVQFYDYTKVPLKNGDKRLALSNYHLTFSRSEDNPLHVLYAINRGTNVAVVFRLKPSESLPKTYLGRPVVDGDVSDLRFLDPDARFYLRGGGKLHGTGPYNGKGIIVGLRAKGPAKRDHAGFVVEVK